MSIRVDRQQYVKITREDGEIITTETMSGQYVDSWLRGSEFFDNLVGKPEVHKKLPGGVIEVTQETPFDTVWVTTFTPTDIDVPKV